MTVRELLAKTAPWLREKGSASPRLEAELLLAHVLEMGRVDLYVSSDRPLSEPEVDAYRDLVRRRAAGEPVAYLTGEKEFYGLSFRVSRDVFIPRPETELLVDRARELGPRRLLDLCTGSGCVAIACAVRLADARVDATEIAPESLAVAQENARRHSVSERIRFFAGDLFEPLPVGERYDLICANPPYVAAGEAAETAGHEPARALFSGVRGLDVIERLLAGAPERLAEEGSLLIEIGSEQGDAVAELAAPLFSAVAVRADLSGLPRVAELSRPR